MDCSFSAPSPPLDESDEPLTPLRSPSRLDFCMEDLENDDSPTHEMEWSCTPFCDCPYTFVEQDPFAIDVAPPAPPRIPTVDRAEDDPPQATDSHAHENTDTTLTFFAPPDPMDEVIIEPQAPIPVRLPSSQTEADFQESIPPPRIAPQRLNYPHHGFSRSALLQQKTLWNSRHDEWAEWQSRMEHGEVQKQESETNSAYTGLATSHPRVIGSPPPYMRTPPSGLERDLTHHPPKKHEQNAHASIYPRVGDVSALRDPYLVNIDRSFFRLPLWTLHKTLYMFDMQQRSALLAPPASAYSAAHVQASLSSSTLSSYSSSTSGDDEESDSTLVADDSPVPKSQLPLEPFQSASSQHSPLSWGTFCGWELSWYAKWELLIGLFQHDRTKYDAFDITVKSTAPPASTAAPSSPPRRIFHFTVGKDEDDIEDDDEDYGTLVADSSFSVDFDEECQRAMAFYSRELKCLEVTLP